MVKKIYDNESEGVLGSNQQSTNIKIATYTSHQCEITVETLYK